jgi:hypothetical protein
MGRKAIISFRPTPALVTSLCPGHVVVELELVFVLVLHQDITDFSVVHMLCILLFGVIPARGANATGNGDAKGAVQNAVTALG